MRVVSGAGEVAARPGRCRALPFFAPVFLQGPDIVVLDEATAALDSQSQDRLMDELVRRLARTMLITVGHRRELESYHDRRITLERAGAAALGSSVMSVSCPNLA